MPHKHSGATASVITSGGMGKARMLVQGSSALFYGR